MFPSPPTPDSSPSNNHKTKDVDPVVYISDEERDRQRGTSLEKANRTSRTYSVPSSVFDSDSDSDSDSGVDAAALEVPNLSSEGASNSVTPNSPSGPLRAITKPGEASSPLQIAMSEPRFSVQDLTQIDSNASGCDKSHLKESIGMSHANPINLEEVTNNPHGPPPSDTESEGPELLPINSLAAKNKDGKPSPATENLDERGQYQNGISGATRPENDSSSEVIIEDSDKDDDMSDFEIKKVASKCHKPTVPPTNQPSLADWQMQLMLLEQQDVKRFLMIQAEDEQRRRSGEKDPIYPFEHNGEVSLEHQDRARLENIQSNNLQSVADLDICIDHTLRDSDHGVTYCSSEDHGLDDCGEEEDENEGDEEEEEEEELDEEEDEDEDDDSSIEDHIPGTTVESYHIPERLNSDLGLRNESILPPPASLETHCTHQTKGSDVLAEFDFERFLDDGRSPSPSDAAMKKASHSDFTKYYDPGFLGVGSTDPPGKPVYSGALGNEDTTINSASLGFSSAHDREGWNILKPVRTFSNAAQGSDSLFDGRDIGCSMYSDGPFTGWPRSNSSQSKPLASNYPSQLPQNDLYKELSATHSKPSSTAHWKGSDVKNSYPGLLNCAPGPEKRTDDVKVQDGSGLKASKLTISSLVNEPTGHNGDNSGSLKRKADEMITDVEVMVCNTLSSPKSSSIDKSQVLDLQDIQPSYTRNDREGAVSQEYTESTSLITQARASDVSEGPARKKVKTAAKRSGLTGAFVTGMLVGGLSLAGAFAAFVATIPDSVREEVLRDF